VQNGDALATQETGGGEVADGSLDRIASVPFDLPHQLAAGQRRRVLVEDHE
jgi:hypothetical protein